jgi:hypothetical protein
VTDASITPIKKKVNAIGGADASEEAADHTAAAATPPLAWAGVADPLAMPEPWDEPVDGADLLDEIETFIGCHVVLPIEAPHAVALWIVFTWAVDAFEVAPILAVLSPAKRSGKSTLLNVLSLVSSRALSASNVTPAALFRVVDEHHPTLLIDEADTWLSLRKEVRGIINSGHFRSGAFVMRASGPNHSLKQFSTFGPKAIAAIGSLPTTIADRSIVVRLSRKSAAQQVEHLRLSRALGETEPLRRRARRWADDHALVLREAEPERVKGLNDRAQDNWEPLLAIADVCGGKWPQRARGAASVLSVTDDEPELGVQLLRDLTEILAARGSPKELFSKVLVGDLLALEERPWRQAWHGKPMNVWGMAWILKPFGVRSTSIGGKARGYRAEDIEAAASLYVG